jgi:hypothetical protein
LSTFFGVVHIHGFDFSNASMTSSSDVDGASLLISNTSNTMSLSGLTNLLPSFTSPSASMLSSLLPLATDMNSSMLVNATNVSSNSTSSDAGLATMLSNSSLVVRLLSYGSH